AAESVRGQVLPLVDPVVPRLAPRGAQLQLVEERCVATEERLFRNAPSCRDGREEAEALVGREDVRPVVAPHELEQVLILVVVVDAAEVVLACSNPRGAPVGPVRRAAPNDLVDLIRNEVLPEGADKGAVRLLSLGAAQD